MYRHGCESAETYKRVGGREAAREPPPYDEGVSVEDEVQGLILDLIANFAPFRLDDASGSLVPADEVRPLPRLADFAFIGTDEAEFELSLRDSAAVRDEQLREIQSRFCLLPGKGRVFVSGPVAWYVGQPMLIREHRPRVPLRMTVVLRNQDGVWHLAHIHVSAGVPNEELFGHRLTTSIEDLAASVEDSELQSIRSRGDSVTIVFTDITSSTDHMVRIGDASWLEVVRWHNWVVREAVVAHGGHEVKGQGDGFMLAFDRAQDALDCMLSLLSSFSAPNDHWDPSRLQVRIGAHTGPAARDLGDYYGTTVVTAARIAGSARGGEALVSDAIATAAPDYAFGEPDSIPLKGLPGMHRVYPLIGRSVRARA